MPSAGVKAKAHVAAGASSEPKSPAKGGDKTKSRKWVYIAGGVIAVALLVILLKAKAASSEETTAAVGSPEAGVGGTGAGGEGATAAAPAPAAVAPPTLTSRGGLALRPGEIREEEEANAGGSIRISETGGAAEPPAPSSSSSSSTASPSAGSHQYPNSVWNHNHPKNKRTNAQEPNWIEYKAPAKTAKRETSKAPAKKTKTATKPKTVATKSATKPGSKAKVNVAKTGGTPAPAKRKAKRK